MSEDKKQTSFDDVLASAKSQNKNLFLYFGAGWCPPCQLMKSQVLVDENVEAKLGEYEVLILDTEQSPELSVKFGVSSIPCFMIVDHNGEVLKRHAGLLQPNAMVEWLTLD